jgi:hypothetical protein
LEDPARKNVIGFAMTAIASTESVSAALRKREAIGAFPLFSTSPQ